MTNDFRTAAATFYDMLDGRPVAPEQHTSLIQWVLAESPGLDDSLLLSQDRAQLIRLLTEQPGAPLLRQRWRSVFRSASAASDQHCIEFLQAVFSSFEDVSGASIEAIEAGVTRSQRGHHSDFHTFRPQSQQRWSIQLTTQGAGQFNCVRQTFNSQVGDMLLFSPEGLYDYRRANSSELWVHHWVYFQPEDSWRPLLRWQELGPGIYHLPLQEPDDQQRFQCLFEEIRQCRYSSVALNRKLASNLLGQLLMRCCLLLPQQVVRQFDQRVERAIEFIRGRYSDAITVADIATRVGISSSRLSTLFKQQTGVAVLAFRDELRMSRACQQLSASGLPIIRVAEEVGYGDPQYFSRSFKQHIGVSPREYRQRHRSAG